MTIRLIFCLLLLAPALASASPDAERLQSIRSLAFNVCSNLLVYYNPNQGDRDPPYAQRYREALQQLQQLTAEEDDSQLIEASDEMRRQIQALQQQPASNAHLYPAWINPLLKAQAALDQRAAKLYTSALPSAPDRRVLHDLILNVERLQLLYQARIFGSLIVYVIDVDDNTFLHLDQEILQGFAALEQGWPQRNAALRRLKGNYDFVRPRLLNNEQSWVSVGVAFYLGHVADGLIVLGARQDEVGSEG